MPSNIMNITLVTAFFDLKAIENRPKDRTNLNYMEWGKWVLGLNINLVIFIEAKNYDYVFKCRREKNLLNKTQIIIKELSQLSFYNLRNELQNYLSENPIINGTIKDTANYLVITWNKLFLLEYVIKTNPFNTNYFGWIDFGLAHVLKNPNRNQLIQKLENINPKISILELRWISNNEIKDIYKYASKFRWKIAGGFFTGNIEYLTIFIKYFKEQLFKLLSMRIATHEEGIFGLVYKFHNKIFNPYFGNYAQIIENYQKITNFVQLIKWNIKFSRKSGAYDHGLKICQKIYKDCYELLGPQDRFKLNDELIICSFYNDKEKSKNYVINWLNELESDNEQIKCIINSNSQQRIINNLSYYDLNIEFVDKFKKYIENNNQ